MASAASVSPDISAKPATTSDSASRPEFVAERVRLLYKLSGEDTPMILMVAGVAVFALWGVVKLSLLLAWSAWLLAAAITRFILARAYARANPPNDQASRWENFYCIASAVLGGIWGMALLYFTPTGRSLPELTIAFLLSTISMGLPPSLAPSPRAFVSFVLPILAPVVALMFSSGGDINTATGLLLLIFTGVLISLYISAHRALMTTLAQGSENVLLLSKLQRANERIDVAVRSSALAVWEWDAGRGTLYLDAAWSAMLGEAAAESYVSWQKLAGNIHADDLPGVRTALTDCLKGTAAHFRAEFRYPLASGEMVWMQAHGEVVERADDGRATRVAGTIVNVNQRKLAEVELFAMLQREKELNEMKSRFVSIASHELRTPLTNILSSAEVLQHYAAKISPEENTRLLQAIQDSALNMSNLISDVLLLGKSDSGKLKFNPVDVDLQDTLSALVESIHFSHGTRHSLGFECALKARHREVDEQLLRHVVSNLLTNAFKYSPEESSVRFRVIEDGDDITIEVTDQGIGIPEADIPKLFSSFHRAANVGDRPGTGLGLSIVKNAAELHGGGIAVDSRIGTGTTFRARLRARVIG